MLKVGSGRRRGLEPSRVILVAAAFSTDGVGSTGPEEIGRSGTPFKPREGTGAVGARNSNIELDVVFAAIGWAGSTTEGPNLSDSFGSSSKPGINGSASAATKLRRDSELETTTCNASFVAIVGSAGVDFSDGMDGVKAGGSWCSCDNAQATTRVAPKASSDR